MPEEYRRYRDRCNKCWPRDVVMDAVRTEPANNIGGEYAFYCCPAGHEWRTYWNYGDTGYQVA